MYEPGETIWTWRVAELRSKALAVTVTIWPERGRAGECVTDAAAIFDASAAGAEMVNSNAARKIAMATLDFKQRSK